MKTIVLIHTTKSTLETYPRQIREGVGFSSFDFQYI